MEDNYYTVSTPGVPLPIKWTAPEAMEKKLFSEKSDVWSFGVVMFELFSRGKEPYIGWPPKDIMQHLHQGLFHFLFCSVENECLGERLACPAECSSDVYDLMLQCWNLDRAKRPNFLQLHHAIKPLAEREEVDARRQDVQQGDYVLDEACYESNGTTYG